MHLGGFAEQMSDKASLLQRVELLLHAQVGVLKAGQYFPFWVNHQSVLHLKVAATEPANLVKLGIGLELIVAPRPRKRSQLLSSSHENEAPSMPAARDVAWIRMQVSDQAGKYFPELMLALKMSS